MDGEKILKKPQREGVTFHCCTLALWILSCSVHSSQNNSLRVYPVLNEQDGQSGPAEDACEKQQLALMSAEISLKQTWKKPTLELGRGSEKAPGVCSCVSLAAEKGALGRGMAGGHGTAGHSHSVSASVTKAIRLCWLEADWSAIISRQVMSWSVSWGQPGNPHWRWMGQGLGGGTGRGVLVPASTPARGALQQPAAPSPA